MSQVSQFMAEGGFPMWPLLLLGMATVALAVVHAALVERWSLLVGVISITVLMAGGMLGRMWGRDTVNRVLGAVEPAQRERLREKGYEEASRPLQLAGGAAVVALLPLGVGELRRRRGGR